MKRVSSQPLLCLALFLAGCLCFLVAWNPEWWSGESYDSGPAGGGRIPGLEPPKRPAPVKPEEGVKPEDSKTLLKPEPKPADTSPAKDPALEPGSP